MALPPLKILNPKPAPAPDVAAPQAVFKDAVLAQVAALPAAARELSFDAIRAALGVDDKALPDGSIMQIAMDANIKCAR